MALYGQLFIAQENILFVKHCVAELWSMKKFALFLTAVLVLFSTVNCKNGKKADNTASDGTVTNTEQVQDTMVLGKLYFVNLKEGEQPVMTGLRLLGNHCGTEDFNNKPYAAEGIRSVFELNEWVEFYPQTNAEKGLKVMVFKHNADQSFYLKNTLNDKTPGYIQECDLNKDPEATNPWGSFYLNPEEVNPGLYDFVFLNNNKVFATMLTNFYKNDELSEKSDAELEQLMTQRASQ